MNSQKPVKQVKWTSSQCVIDESGGQVTNLLLVVITRDVSVTIHPVRSVFHIIFMSFKEEQKSVLGYMQGSYGLSPI